LTIALRTLAAELALTAGSAAGVRDRAIVATLERRQERIGGSQAK
jgi:hypothetical protein